MSFINKSNKVCIFCNKKRKIIRSHSIPRFLLKRISKTGYVYTFHYFNNFMYQKKSVGIAKANVFYSLCGECDNKYFNTYEGELNVDNISNRYLQEIALKNTVNILCRKKRLVNAAVILYTSEVNRMLKMWIKEEGIDKRFPVICDVDYVIDFRINEYSNFIKPKYNHLKKFLDDYSAQFLSTASANTNLMLENFRSLCKYRDQEVNFDLMFYLNLDYKTPIAIQDEINLLLDFDNDIINDNRQSVQKFVRQYGFHLCVFPGENSTRILLFTDSKWTFKYKNFFAKLNAFSLKEQLESINFIIFMYTDTYLISDELNENILIKLKEDYKKISSKDFFICKDNEKSKKIYEQYLNWYNFKNRNEIINLLQPEYKL